MDTSQETTDEKARSGPSTADRVRWLYAGMSVLILILVFAGFQQFYLHGKAAGGRPLTSPIQPLIIVHGIAMTVWVGLLIVQSMLVVTHKVRLHMTLGKIGAVLAVIIVILGFKLGIESARYAPEKLRFHPSGSAYVALTPKQFMAIPILSIIVFAAYVSIAIVNRKKPDIHRPLMLFATITVMGAATARTGFFHSIYDNTLWGGIFGPASLPMAVGLLFLLLYGILARTFDRRIALIWVITAIIDAGTMVLAPTPAWDAIATFLLKL